MQQHEFRSLKDALTFVAAHGGPAEDVDRIPSHWLASGAFGPAAAAVKLADGAYFAVEAYTNGPLSDITPDEDFGVKLLGWSV